MHVSLYRYAPKENVVQALAAYTQLATRLEGSVDRRFRHLEGSGRTPEAADCEALVDMSMRWVLQRSFVSGAVVGARTHEQLSTVVKASLREESLASDVLQAVDGVHEWCPNPCP